MKLHCINKTSDCHFKILQWNLLNFAKNKHSSKRHNFWMQISVHFLELPFILYLIFFFFGGGGGGGGREGGGEKADISLMFP